MDTGSHADAVRLSAAQALALGEQVMRRIGYSAGESAIVAANLLDAELCGYPALGMARLITIADDPRARQPRTPVVVTHETPVSALIDGGNYVGLYALHRAVDIALDKARAQGLAIVGVYNSFLSGRNALYVEKIARAGFVALHTASGEPYVVPLGGRVCAFGTNPLAFGLPGEPDPLVFDMGTSAITHGEVVLAARLNLPLPHGVAIDSEGAETCDAGAALAGGILPFGGHKGYGLSFMIQALGLLAGAALPRGRVQDFGFLFVVFAPGLLVPHQQFMDQLTELIEAVKTTPRQPGVAQIRIPSERAFHERERRQRDGIVLERRLYERLLALS